MSDGGKGSGRRATQDDKAYAANWERIFGKEDNTNEEEAWLHHVIKDFDYIVCSGKYGPHFYKYLSDDAKVILNNLHKFHSGELDVHVSSN